MAMIGSGRDQSSNVGFRGSVSFRREVATSHLTTPSNPRLSLPAVSELIAGNAQLSAACDTRERISLRTRNSPRNGRSNQRPSVSGPGDRSRPFASFPQPEPPSGSSAPCRAIPNHHPSDHRDHVVCLFIPHRPAVVGSHGERHAHAHHEHFRRLRRVQLSSGIPLLPLRTDRPWPVVVSARPRCVHVTRIVDRRRFRGCAAQRASDHGHTNKVAQGSTQVSRAYGRRTIITAQPVTTQQRAGCERG